MTDENFDNHIVRGLLRRLPAIALIRVQDVGLGQTDDRAILLTHDRHTVPGFADVPRTHRRLEKIQRASEAERPPSLVLGAAAFAGLDDHGSR